MPVLLALAHIPLEVPFTLDSVVKVLPARQWVLSHTPDGSLTAAVYDHRTGMVRRQEDYQFDRGDQVQMRFQDDWKAGTRVKAGETVASIVSNRLSEQLVLLKNQLAVEEANLGVVASGQKPQVIAQFEEEVSLARADVELRRKTLERTKQLQAEGLIAALAVEQAENTLHDAQARVRLAEKSLATATSGEKQEVVTVTSSRIASLQKQIEFLENKRNKYEIATPFAGEIRVENSLEGDRLLVEDTTALILQMPVRLRDVRYLQQGQRIEMQWLDQSVTTPATVLEIGRRVETISFEQVVYVKALVESRENQEALDFAPGTSVRCRIIVERIKLGEFLRRSLRWQL